MKDLVFEQLVADHQAAVYAYARSLTRSESLAEEATQETFVRAWKYLDSFRGEGSKEGWLIRICRRCVLDLASRGHDRVVVDMGPSVQAPDASAELWSLLDDLSVYDREVLVVCGVLGYDYESAAAILDVPVGTIRSRLSRARDRLRSTYQEAARA